MSVPATPPPGSGPGTARVPGPDRAGGRRAWIVEGSGGLRAYTAGRREVPCGHAAGQVRSSARSRCLAPWPDRIRDGRHEFAGRSSGLRGPSLSGATRSPASPAGANRTPASVSCSPPPHRETRRAGTRRGRSPPGGCPGGTERKGVEHRALRA